MFKKLIGIDFGMLKIGIAFGQTLTGTTSPLAVVKAKSGIPNWLFLDRIIKEWLPNEIIIGLPIDFNGKETEITKETYKFSDSVKKRYQKPVSLISETFSTREVKWKMDQIKHNRSKIDSFAACIILETWMNEQK